VEKSKISINVEGEFLFCGGWNFFKSVSVGSTFIREMRVRVNSNLISNILLPSKPCRALPRQTERQT
jgi:hypothetical protein